MFVLENVVKGGYSISRAVYKHSNSGKLLVIDGEINDKRLIPKGSKRQILSTLNK